ncbi:MAG: arsenosugar biosynthesis radical SAM protein ArsS [Spirochaetaceae bacterium]|nr:arsenosugar biosynthesis radical SAM protein ArsS [Spirochaetaceae bacterium]
MNEIIHRNDFLLKSPLKEEIRTVQLNLGARCNQTCRHCHINAGPKRTETMNISVIDRAFELIKKHVSIKTLDLTGGAPELNPHFRSIIERAYELDIEIIDRNNLTVLFEKGQEYLPRFLAEHRVTIIASLPCYGKENVDFQRGLNIFEKSIHALKILNNLGYGKKDTGLTLDLVYNPRGAALPGNQQELENDYHKQLYDNYGIEFNHLYTITNVPIARFKEDLMGQGEYQNYLQLLSENFNSETVSSLMCRNLVSVGWDGTFYDCDFNLALNLPSSVKKTVFSIQSFDELKDAKIQGGHHCLACTAGAGSSCKGSLRKTSIKTLQEAEV